MLRTHAQISNDGLTVGSLLQALSRPDGRVGQAETQH